MSMRFGGKAKCGTREGSRENQRTKNA